MGTKMRRTVSIIALAALPFLSGCVSVGIECSSGSTKAWAKVRRVGYGIPRRQAETLRIFRENVCR